LTNGYWRNATLLLRQMVLVAAAVGGAFALAGIVAKFIAALVFRPSERFFSIEKLNRLLVVPPFRYFVYTVVLIAAGYYFVYGQERFSVAKPDLYVLLVVLIVASELLAFYVKRRD